MGEHRVAVLIMGVVVVVVVVLVALSLEREPPAGFAPTAFEAREVGDSLVGPVTVTVNATDPDRWVYFDFSRGAPIGDPGALGWDIAFKRFNVTVNGGDGFAGRGGALDLGPVTVDSVGEVPGTGYALSDARQDSTNPAIQRWYDYGFTSHLLTPRPRTYAVRTADGRYAVLRIGSYYCPGAQPGCLTFTYLYRGDGSREF